jgi:hypothetical protein
MSQLPETVIASSLYWLWVGGSDPGKRPYRWEIRRRGKSTSLEVSVDRYRRMQEAHEAGLLKLREWERDAQYR